MAGKKTTAAKAAKEPTPVVGEVVSMDIESANLETQVDLKLSKQDLVEMVVEDTRDALEKQLNAAQIRRNESQRLVDKQIKGFNKVLSDDFEKKFKKEIAYAEKMVGDKPKYKRSERFDVSVDRDMCLIEDGTMLSRKDQNEYLDENGFDGIQYNGQDSNRANKNYLKVIPLVNKVQFSVCTNVPYNNDDSDDGKYFSFIINYSYKKEELKKLLFTDQALWTSLAEDKKICKDLESKLVELNGMGRKVKVNLTRQILGSTKDGQSVVNSIDAIKASLNQTLALTFTKK